ncbi:MAG: TIGR02710 family CRISPR-associated protein [Actinobacteria bacterium]|nr:TIGR02710 family CRISPR-associated protein [Actinomycetota bacterium]
MNGNKKVLIITVGGSPEPIISSINEFEPNEIVFICSQSSKKEVNKILNKTASSYDNYYIEIVNADNPNDVFEKSNEIIRKYLLIGYVLLADYTGGTKSMSLGLASAASTSGVRIRFMGGRRENLNQVVDGTEQPLEFNFLWIDYSLAVELFNKGHYAAAEKIFTKITNLATIDSLQIKADKLKKLSKGLYLWDIFEHEKAHSILKIFHHDYPELLGVLLKIVKPNIAKGSHGYELIFDLVANSKRCSSSGRFDDACGRLYRAVEFLAQQRLRSKYNIDTSCVDINKIPTSFNLPKLNNKGIIQISRSDGYELLRVFKDNVSLIYQKYKDSINENMKIRNESILAHGFKPVTALDFRHFNKVVEIFLKEALTAMSLEWKDIVFPITE